MPIEAILWEWLSLAVRWLHVIAAIAWIGSSFYFIHLDLSLRRREGLPEGAHGEAWQVHGGGFYHMVKFLVAPARMPDELTWFKWEAYATLLSGLALLAIVYYCSADLYLIDRNIRDLTPWQAIAVSAIGIVAGLAIYEGLCRSPLATHENLVAAIGFAIVVAASWGWTQIFSGRGAMMQMGATLGTIMAASVFHVIIPNQRKVVADLIAGRKPDPRLGQIAKQRSVHNNYLTLGVLFVMLASHYPLAFATRFNWLILAIIIVIGALIRSFYNARHAGRPSPWWIWGAVAVGAASIIWLSSFGGSQSPRAAMAGPPPSFASVQDIVATRCAMCHAEEPVWAGLAHAPKGLRLDTADRIRRHAGEIALHTAFTDAMPPGNLTMIDAEERAVLAAWAAAERARR
jgi:uncharacterized membrane protein